MKDCFDAMMNSSDISGSPKRPWLLVIFLISLVSPFLIQAGPIQLTAYRIILLVAVAPTFILWMKGRAGSIRLADILLILVCIWVALSFAVIHGPSVALEAGGIYAVETLGAYFLARCLVRDAITFKFIVKVLFWIILFMLPLGLYETLTSNNIILSAAEKIGTAHDVVPKEPRWGFDRVQGSFSHPILFGVFCGSAPALVYYVLGYKHSLISKWSKVALVTFTTILSLSSGPLAGLNAQLLLIAWDRLTQSLKTRWMILSGGLLSLVVAIEIAANRSTPELFISYFAFNTRTAFNRIHIWKYGTTSVENFPLFGVGRNEWERPYWMSSSIDMFWLVPAVRNGLPAAVMLHFAFVMVFILIAFKQNLSERASSYRTGYLLCMVGFYLSGWTVHYWREIYVFFVFLFGSGFWLLETKSEPMKRQEGFTDGHTLSSELDDPKIVDTNNSNKRRKTASRNSAPRYTRFPSS